MVINIDVFIKCCEMMANDRGVRSGGVGYLHGMCRIPTQRVLSTHTVRVRCRLQLLMPIVG